MKISEGITIRKSKHITEYFINNGYSLEKYSVSLKNCLYELYVVQQKTMREISVILYTHEGNAKTIRKYFNIFNLPIRHGGEAIKAQYVGEKRESRRRIIIEKSIPIMNSKENRAKLIKIMQTDEYREKSSKSKLGKLNPMYNFELTSEERRLLGRHSNAAGYRPWVRKVYERDLYTCQISGCKVKSKLAVHHLEAYNSCEEGRLDVNNGIIIRRDIHVLFHRLYGYGGNTEPQFIEFKDRYISGEFCVEMVVDLIP